MIQTERINEEEIKVTTENSRGTYEYIFEYASFSWILKEKRVNGESQDISKVDNVSNQVRKAVKEEAEDPDGDILDNLDMVTTNQGTLKIKHEDTLAKWGEDLARDFFKEKEDERLAELAEDSHYNTLTECKFCGKEKYCREVDDHYFCCTDCEESNPEELRIDRKNLLRPQNTE